MGEPKVSDATRGADRRDAQMTGQPDRMPTAEEEARADKLQLDPDVAANAEDAAARGANAKGEGRIEQ